MLYVSGFDDISCYRSLVADREDTTHVKGCLYHQTDSLYVLLVNILTYHVALGCHGLTSSPLCQSWLGKDFLLLRMSVSYIGYYKMIAKPPCSCV